MHTVILVLQQAIYAHKMLGVYRVLLNMLPNVGVATFRARKLLRVGIAVFITLPQIIMQQLLLAAVAASAPLWREAFCATCQQLVKVCVNAKPLRVLLPMMVSVA